MRPILVADLFCGAGGSSTGARQAIERLGRRMDLVCVNHWDRAIETHARNHPEARHYCQDVASARPIECVPGGRLDLLMASPTCTYHSRARGGRPTSDQQRMDPWHVVTWLTELRVDRLLVENVPEFVDWGPVDQRTGRPLKSKRGLYFREWIATLERLGYRVEWKVLNCADYGDATTRRRFFLLGRKRGLSGGRNGLRWPEPTHAKEPRHDLLAPLKRWRPARECIDWTLRGRSIYGRKVPLAPRTLQRIYAGAVRFAWPEPYLVVLRQHMAARSIDFPLPTIVANGGHIGLVQPVILSAAKDLMPPALEYVGHPGDEILRYAQDDRGVSQRRSSSAPATGIARIGLAHPVAPRPSVILSVAKDLMPQAREESGRTGDEILRYAQDDRGGVALPVEGEPFILSQASGGAPRSVAQPLPTITTGGRQGEGTALITPYYGAGKGCKPVDEPLDTVTTLDRFGLIVPVTHSGGGNQARDIGAPLPTLTTAKGGELAFITASFGERDGQLPRTHDLDLPMPTIPATGSVRLAEGVEAPGEGPMEGGVQYDILFRMLQPAELARAMSLEDYDFAGTKTEVTKQIGNAVPRRMARALVAASLYDMEA